MNFSDDVRVGKPIDKIRFTVNKEIRINQRFLDRVVHDTVMEASGYQFARKFTLSNGASLFLSWQPTPLARRSYAAIEINPARFDNWKLFHSGLQQAFCDYSLDDFKISRVDLCVDINVPLDFFRKSLLVKRMRTNETFSSTSNTLVFGKSPKRISLYDRYKGKKLNSETEITRIEFQLRGNRCPIQKLSEVDKLYDLDLFSNFQFFKYKGGSDPIIEKGICQTMCFKSTLAEFVRSISPQNFRQYVRKGYFERIEGPNLLKIYRDNIQRFINPVNNNNLRTFDECNLES